MAANLGFTPAAKKIRPEMSNDKDFGDHSTRASKVDILDQLVRMEEANAQCHSELTSHLSRLEAKAEDQENSLQRLSERVAALESSVAAGGAEAPDLSALRSAVREL